jgi:hypothetical protein
VDEGWTVRRQSVLPDVGAVTGDAAAEPRGGRNLLDPDVGPFGQSGEVPVEIVYR